MEETFRRALDKGGRAGAARRPARAREARRDRSAEADMVGLKIDWLEAM